ncbi:hypothetical protein TNCV_984721 [Trichonephila clavipes]|nr:hypothetical protein TNCV_984721 [Trichonephila clavipes]
MPDVRARSENVLTARCQTFQIPLEELERAEKMRLEELERAEKMRLEELERAEKNKIGGVSKGAGIKRERITAEI